MPIDWDENGKPNAFEYFAADVCIDPFDDNDHSEFHITGAEFEKKIDDLGEMKNIFADARKWDSEWWNQHEDSGRFVIIKTVRTEVLNWPIS